MMLSLPLSAKTNPEPASHVVVAWETLLGSFAHATGLKSAHGFSLRTEEKALLLLSLA